MNAPKNITVRSSKFELVREFGATAASLTIGCIQQAEYVGKRGRSAFVQFFQDGTCRAIFNGGQVEQVMI